MEYFLIEPDSGIKHGIVWKEIEKKLSDQVCIMPFSNKICFLDYIKAEELLVSEKLKQILALYEPDLRWELLALVDPEQREQKIYFRTVELPAVDCIDKRTKFSDSGNLLHLVLNQARMNQSSIFYVRTKKEQFLIINLDVAESILRRELYGINLRRVACVWEE